MKDTCPRIALVGQTVADVRDVMIEGDSGILASAPPWDKPEYLPSKRELRWPNGSICKTYSGDEPDQLRGPQHHAAWYDELAKFQYPDDAWDQGQFGLRLGDWPRALVTTTPRPIQIMRKLMAEPDTYVTRGSTFDNAANLAPSFLKAIRAKYEGTRLGRQELFAEMLGDLVGALWTGEMLDGATHRGPLPALGRTVIGVDPSGFDGETGDSQGIVVASLGDDGICYVIEDATVRLRPEGWGAHVVAMFHKYAADRIVVEKNYGGGMCRAVIHAADPSVPVVDVDAAKGKHIRAEPVSRLYETGRVKHAKNFPELIEQMSLMTTQGFEGKGSPDRLDAMVWAVTDLMKPRSSIYFEEI